MARIVKNFANLEGNIWAFSYPDGSLTIEVRYKGKGKQWSYRDAVEISPEGVKLLLEVLDRDAQLRIGADDAGHTCPSCAGNGYSWNEYAGDIQCETCNGTGQA